MKKVFQLVALLCSSSWCLVTVIILWFFLTVPLVGLWCVIGVFLDHTHIFLTLGPICRAYPDSEFVVANTLAKWNKLEPNEINFSQGFSQKVSTSCFAFNSLPALPADNLCKQF